MRLVGTDLVQAVPLVLAAAISNIALNGLDWYDPDPAGDRLGARARILGSRIAPRVPQSFIRRGIVIVLTMSGLALLDKAGWAPLGAGEDETHPMLIALRRPGDGRASSRSSGACCAGSRACRCSARPTVAELEGDRSTPRRPHAPHGVSDRTTLGDRRGRHPGRPAR